MEIVDFHAHVWTKIDGIAAGQTTKSSTYGKVAYEDHTLERWMPPSFAESAATPEMLLEYMDWVGIDKAVLMQAPGYGSFNKYYAQLLQHYPKRFIGALGLADPREGEKAVEELVEIVTVYGLNGVKFQVADTQFVLDDERYSPFWATLADLGGIAAFDLFVRPNDPYGWQIDALERTIAVFTDVRFVLLHLGTPSLLNVSQTYPFPDLQRALQLSRYPNVWFELGGLPWICGDEEFPYERGQQMVKAVVEVTGADRLIWGSDWPCTLRQCTYQQNVDIVRKYCQFLTLEERQSILAGTARRLLGLEK